MVQRSKFFLQPNIWWDLLEISNLLIILEIRLKSFQTPHSVMIWPAPVKRWYVVNVGRISWERPWRWPSSSDLCLRPNSDINPLIRLAFAFCYVPKQRCREHWHKVWFVNSPFNYWIFSARKQVFCIIDQYMTFWEWFLASHCNSNGYIAQKKLIILFCLGAPIDLRSMHLNCILGNLFRDTLLDHI